jgi:hypothetical protein
MKSNVWKRAGKMAALAVLFLLVSGCAIASRSDKFGADLDLGVGGILSYIADLHLKMSVGFSKTCTEATNGETAHAGGSDPLGDLDDFL